MKTQVIMKRSLFDGEVSQQSNTGFFSATDLVRSGNKWRGKNNLSAFNLALYLKGKNFKEFLNEVENKHGVAIKKGRGRNSNTWVHPLIFIDIALAIDPKLKVEVYDWLFDNLIKFRNNSGDTYKEMAGAIFLHMDNKRDFQKYIIRVANYIKKEIGVDSWELANEAQLLKRDKIHTSIKLLCNVLKNTDHAVRVGVIEIMKE